MDPNNRFTKEQQEHYDFHAVKWSPTNRDPIVGSFDQHNSWKDYDIYLFKGIDTAGKIALDFGTGPGRNIVKFSNRFQRIDGVDISEVNLQKALDWCIFNKIATMPLLYKNDGTNIDAVPSDTYDIIFSTIAMQHICVYDIRFAMFQGFYRALKKGGNICIQMGFQSGHAGTKSYYENSCDKGWQDVSFDDPNLLKMDLEKIGFTNFNYDLRPAGPGDTGHKQWIFFRATK